MCIITVATCFRRLGVVDYVKSAIDIDWYVIANFGDIYIEPTHVERIYLL